MKRLLLAVATLAGVAALASSGTYASFSDTKVNTATWQAQATFPPLNTAAPTISSVTVVVTTLTGHLGSWAVTNPGTTTYTMQWQRCSSGTCSDIAGESSVSSLLTGTLDHVVSVADAGTTLRLEVTATDSSIPVTDRRATIVFSAEVPA